MQSELGKRILATILKSAGIASPRTLYVFANPLGNAVGDTVIATQHLPYLKCIPDNRITVWTSNGDIWKAFSGSGVETKATVTEREILEEYDLIFLDWVNCGRDFQAIVNRSRAVVFDWNSRTTHLDVRLPNEPIQYVYLKPSTNHPARIAELYAELGWTAEVKPPLNFRAQRTHIGKALYFNPYASTAEKSMPVDLAIELLHHVRNFCGQDMKIAIGPRPRATSEGDRTFFAGLEHRLTEECSQIYNVVFQSGSMESYVEAVRRSTCVLCPDTSSQHVAGIFGTPAVVLYPPKREYNHFAFGWLDADVYSLKMKLAPDYSGLKELVGHIISSIVNGNTLTNNELSLALGTFKTVLRKVREPEFFDSRIQQEVKRAFMELDRFMPRSWAPYLMPELARAVRELEEKSVSKIAGVDFLMRRVESLSGIKIMDTVLCQNSSSGFAT